MVILIRFFQRIANEQMVLEVSGPVLFRAVRGNTAGIAGVFHVLRRIGLKMLRVRAICSTFDGRGAFTHGWRGRLVHDVEEVVGLEEDAGTGFVMFVGGVVTGGGGGYLGGERWGRGAPPLTTEHGEEGALRLERGDSPILPLPFGCGTEG